MTCTVNECDRPINRDGVCFTHKIKTVRLNGTAGLKREREGNDLTNGMGTEAYVKNMYAKARAEGRPDPVPKNREAARYAPAAGVNKGKKYKEANNGL